MTTSSSAATPAQRLMSVAQASYSSASVRRGGGGLVPFSAVCNCPSGRRRPPIRYNRTLAAALVQAYPEHQQLMSYRCSDCGGIVPLTVGHLDLTAPATSPS